jgi:ABC-type amino acid transport substrate-binding protein
MRRLVVAALLLLAFVGGAAAQDPEPTLQVGTRVAPPFAMKAADGDWEGISIDLWEHIAGELGRKFEWHETTLAGMIDEVESGQLDLSIAAMTVTRERETRVDFSHPIFRSTLGVAVAHRPWSGIRATLQALASPEFLSTVGLLLVLLFVVGALAWAAERRRNPKEFDPELRRGLGSGIWWAAVTMTTVGYGDKTPITTLGRVLATVWMFAALVLTAVFTAQLAANIASHHVGAQIRTPAELARLRIGAVADSASLEPLRQLGARPVGFLSVADGFAALEAGDIDAFVHDTPILIWEAAGNRAIALADLRFAPHDYAIVLPEQSPLREPNNRALLNDLETPAWDATVDRYLGIEALR